MKNISITSYGVTYTDCYFVLSHYTNNNNLAIGIVSKSEGPLTTLTVNIDKLEYGLAAIDINNCPFAEDIIIGYSFGRPVGYMSSGFVDYPVYELDINKLLEYSKKLD